MEGKRGCVRVGGVKRDEEWGKGEMRWEGELCGRVMMN